MLSRVKQEPAHHRLEQREKRAHRSDTGDYVVKNRQQLQVLGVVVQLRIELLRLALAPARTWGASGSTGEIYEQVHEHE
jgi:hypothetical protein